MSFYRMFSPGCVTVKEIKTVLPIYNAHCDKCGAQAPVNVIRNESVLVGFLCEDKCYPEWRDLIIEAKCNDLAWRFNNGKFEVLIRDYIPNGSIIAGTKEPVCSEVWVQVKNLYDLKLKAGL